MSYIRWGKRAVDLAVATTLLVIVAPVMCVIALTLRIVQGRPVFFTQARIGLNFEVFQLYKFRSMQQASSLVQAGFAPGTADRRTSVGKVLRASKLDELPQLLNVIKGEMSLVGPRPEVPEWVDIDSREWKQVLSVRPGLTDYASIAYFDEEKRLRESSDPDKTYRESILPEKLVMAQEYIKKQSFKVDINLMLLTLKQLFRH